MGTEQRQIIGLSLAVYGFDILLSVIRSILSLGEAVALSCGEYNDTRL